MVNVSEGMPLTHRKFQMKLFSTIVTLAAVIGTSLITVSPTTAAYLNFNSNWKRGSAYTNGFGSNGYSFNGSSRRIGSANSFNGSNSYGNRYNGNCRNIGSFTNYTMY